MRREVGKIKWYEGHNSKARLDNYYGFITCNNKQDIYIHGRQIGSLGALLEKGTAITFEIHTNTSEGRDEAINVILLEDETNLDILKKCFQSNDPSLWKAVTRKYLSKLQEQEVPALATKKLHTLVDSDKQIFACLVPESILFLPKSKDLRRALPYDRHIDIYLKILGNKSELPEEHKFLFYELKERLERAKSDKGIWELVPESILLNDEIWHLVPMNKKIEILSKLYEESKKEQIILQITDILSQCSSNDIQSIIEDLPDFIKQHDAIFPFLTPIQQIHTIRQFLINGELSIWQKLSNKTKILCTYYIAKEDLNIPFENIEEKNLLVRCALILLWTKNQDFSKKQTLFIKAHNLFQDYVIQRAWNSTDPLEIDPLLPLCKLKVVKYCEARPWPLGNEKNRSKISRAFCPRDKKPYGIFGQKDGKLMKCARLYAICSQDWKDWSIFELLENAGITPNLTELGSSIEYVPRLCGWVNRVNEIRKRLKCSVCEQMMIPNFAYAKKLAVYNSTVVSCQVNDKHDQNVYLSHCWACDDIIDSRESRFRYEEYYICIHCGSGPQKSSRYTQGDICPKCGAPNMMKIIDDDRERKCRDCKHKIYLPPEHKLTGPNSSGKNQK